MKILKHSWLIVLFVIGFFCTSKSQCSLFYFFTNNYDCVTNLANTSFTINGATAPYTCTFVNTVTNVTVAVGSTIGNTGTVTSIPVGNFNIFISSANNCTASTAFNVTIPFSSSNVVFTSTNVSCFGGSNGASFATVNSSFFIPPFSYSWTTGATVSTATNLSAATIYSVTIKDAQGCSVTNTVTITEPSLINSSLTNTFITCYGKSISSGITTTGGISQYTYTIDVTPVIGTTAINLFAGTHTIITKDNNGCLQTNTVIINQVVQPQISFIITQPSCPGKSDGAVVSSVSSAPPAYSYTWQPALSNASSLSGIPIGTYTLTVKDGSACITKSVAIVLPVASMNIGVTSKPENCSAVDGAATLIISGGNAPYSFTTQPIVGAHISNTIGLLSSGGYTTVIKDANNCIDTLKFNIGNLTTVSLSVASFTPVKCYNQCTGSIQLSVQNAVSPVSYSVSGQALTNSSFITNLCPGFYVIKATDAIGCPATTTINFSTPTVFAYSASATGPVCVGKSVVMQASASGGAGNYNYVWNPGNINGQLVTLFPTSTTVYSLNVYDTNGCTLAPYSVTVNVNPPLAININTVSVGICPGSTAQITPTVTGGDGNYIYNWLPGNITSPSIFVENASIPSYTLSVNDGCGSQPAIKIIPINLFPVTKPVFSVNNNKGCEPFCTTFSNLTPKASNVIWNYGDKPFEQTGAITNYCYQKSGVYAIRLTLNDSNNCKTSFTYSNVINVLPKPNADFQTDPNRVTTNNANNVLIKSLGDDITQFTWLINDVDVGQNKEIFYTFADTGCYHIRLIAENQNNCNDTADKFVCVIEGFNIFMPNCITVNNDNLNEILIPQGTGWNTNDYLFEIYNRWGIRVFKTNDFTKGWDAKSMGGGTTVPQDIYYWRILTADYLENTYELKGYVTVLR